MAQLNFDTQGVEADAGFDLLPAGKYVGQVVDSTLVELKAKNGHLLKLTIEVLSEGYRGRKIFTQLCVNHPNDQAERIARQKLASLYDAAGVPRTQRDTNALHNRPVGIRVKIEHDATGQYEDKNEISGYMKADGIVAPARPQPGFQRPAASPAPAATQSSASAGQQTSIPPWQRG